MLKFYLKFDSSGQHTLGCAPGRESCLLKRRECLCFVMVEDKVPVTRAGCDSAAFDVVSMYCCSSSRGAHADFNCCHVTSPEPCGFLVAASSMRTQAYRCFHAFSCVFKMVRNLCSDTFSGTFMLCCCCCCCYCLLPVSQNDYFRKGFDSCNGGA